MEPVTLTFKLLRETKGAVRYQEVDANGNPIDLELAHVGTIYFRKAQLGTPPAALTITVKEA